MIQPKPIEASQNRVCEWSQLKNSVRYRLTNARQPEARQNRLRPCCVISKQHTVPPGFFLQTCLILSSLVQTDVKSIMKGDFISNDETEWLMYLL